MRYSERVLPGPLWWLGVVVAAVAFGIIFIPVDPFLSVGVSLVVLIAGMVALFMSSYQIIINGSTIRVGRAEIPIEFLKNPQIIESSSWNDSLRHSEDATVFSATRPWVRTGIQCDLIDPQDPVQTWLIGSRYPQKITELLAAYAAHSEHTGSEFSS